MGPSWCTGAGAPLKACARCECTIKRAHACPTPKHTTARTRVDIELEGSHRQHAQLEKVKYGSTHIVAGARKSQGVGLWAVAAGGVRARRCPVPGPLAHSNPLGGARQNELLQRVSPAEEEGKGLQRHGDAAVLLGGLREELPRRVGAKGSAQV